MEADTGEAFRRLYKLTKFFSGASGGELRSAPLAVAEEGKHKVESFQENLPLIAAICNPGLRDRHWAVGATRACVHVCVCLCLVCECVWRGAGRAGIGVLKAGDRYSWSNM